MIVLLAAGKSTRVGGANKLLVEAAGEPVHEWHKRAASGRATVAVVNAKHAQQVREEAPWLSSIIEHDAHDGPGGALLAFDRAKPHGEIIVLFADTLLQRVPDVHGDWVGVAPAPGRVWDYYDKVEGWTRGVPAVLVCCGVYRFTNRPLLREVLEELVAEANEVHIADVLRVYSERQRLSELVIDGWQDAGDTEALRRVHRLES